MGGWHPAPDHHPALHLRLLKLPMTLALTLVDDAGECRWRRIGTVTALQSPRARR